MKRPGRPGFTLIELMLVVAIIGLLAAIAIPKFANLVVKAKEASTKGKLGSVRSAISIYYADNEGNYFRCNFTVHTLSLVLVPKYLDEVPAIVIPTAPSHQPGNWDSYQTGGFLGGMDANLNGNLPYGLMNTNVGEMFSGELIITCSHTDTTGRPWSTW